MAWIFGVFADGVKHWARGLAYIGPLVLLLIIAQLAFIQFEYWIYFLGSMFLAPAFILCASPTWRLHQPIGVCIRAGGPFWLVLFAVCTVCAFIFALLSLITVTLVAIIIAVSLGADQSFNTLIELGSDEVSALLGPGQRTTIAGLVILATFAILWVWGRFSPALIAATIERRFVVMEAWNWTRPYAGRIFGSQVVLVLLTWVSFFQFAALVSMDVLGLAMMFLYGYLLIFFNVSIAMAIYFRVAPKAHLEN